VSFDVGGKFPLGIARVRSLSGDIDDSIVNNQRGVECRSISGLTFVVEFADVTLVLVCSVGRAAK